jgi:hypothetical protein
MVKQIIKKPSGFFDPGRLLIIVKKSLSGYCTYDNNGDNNSDADYLTAQKA